MKGKIFMLLFALPFFGVGVWMGYSIANDMLDVRKMKQWQPVSATLSQGGYRSQTGDDSTTYRAYASYTYEYAGRQFSGDRVGISDGADNIGDYQQDMGRWLSAALQRGDRVTVYVNPDDPSMAIVDRSLRWAMVGFDSIFFFVFGGVGLGLIIFSLRTPKPKDLSAPEYSDSPWLANDDWQSAQIKSSSKLTMFFAWGFAAFWNLISAPLPFVIYSEITEKNNWPALFGVLFPIVGIGLIIWAVRRTREWNRFGPVPVTLDPFPGSIGGHVGGTIDIKLPYDANTRFSVTLTNLRSFVSGSGKNRSRSESAEWQDTQVAHSSFGTKGTRLAFRFAVPQHLTESDAAPETDTYYLWRLNLKAALDGVDIDRDYEIPVYTTAESSSQLAGFPAEQARNQQRLIDIKALEELFEIRFGSAGKSMFFPMARNLLSSLSGVVFGAVFTGVGWFLMFREDHAIMGGVFGGIGLLVIVGAVYTAINSLEISREGGDLVSVRRLLGFPVRHSRMRRSDIRRFSKKVSSTTQSGKKHTVRYALFAVDQNGKKMLVGEGFRGAGQADAAADYIASAFGLTIKNDNLSILSQSGDYDLLTAD